MKVGCVKEIKNNEFRVGLTPDNVKAYVAAGHEEPASVPGLQMKSMKQPVPSFLRQQRLCGMCAT